MADDLIESIKNSLGGFVKDLGESLSSQLDPTKIAKTITEVDNAAVNIAKSFGQGRENVLGLSQAMAGAVREVTLLGGGFQQIADIQQRVSQGLGRNIILTTESFEKLYAAQKVSGENAETIVTSFKNAGFSAYQASSQMENVVNVARTMGVNAQAVSQKVLENMDALNKYNFAGGVEGLSKMAAQATSLRINMNDTLSFAEKVFDPEGAIEVAAAMQRLGVANSELLDPLRLMDLSQNDPAELQNQLTKMTEKFVQLNEKGQFEIMPGAKRQLREISLALNIPFETLTKMAIGTKELDDKLQRINFAGLNFTEEQKNIIAQMSEMGKDGQFKIAVEGKGEMDLDKALVEFQNNPQLLEALEKSAQPKTMEELAKEQLTVLESIKANVEALGTSLPFAFAGTKTAKDALTAAVDITGGIENVITGTESMKISNLTKGLGEGTEKVLTSINRLVKGEGSMTELITTVGELEKKFENFSLKAAEDMVGKYSESIEKLNGSTNQFIQLIMNIGKTFATKAAASEGVNTKPQTIQAQDLLIKTLPEDTLVMAAGTKLGETPTQTNTTPSTVNVNLKVDVTAPPNVNPNDIILALGNESIKESIVLATMKGFTGNGLSSNNSNPQQQLNNARNIIASTGMA